MVTVSLRIDDVTKQQLDQMCDEMGMNLTTFFMIYAKAALREKKIPFEIRANNNFFSQDNLAAIAHSEEEARQGKTIPKTLSELEAMEK